MLRPFLCTLLLTTTLAAQTLTDLQRRAAAGDHEAQTVLGTLYETGDGVPLDPARALRLYREAAAAGHVGAQINLATMYLEGAGVKKDAVAAVQWFTRRRGRQHAGAVEPRDDLRSGSRRWRTRRAPGRYGQAAQGLMPAQYRLGRSTRRARRAARSRSGGDVVRKPLIKPTRPRSCGSASCSAPATGARTDVVEAYKWLNLSASRWKSEACAWRRRRRRAREQMTEAQVSEASSAARWQDTVGMQQK
jgi:TPR repeat protein